MSIINMLRQFRHRRKIWHDCTPMAGAWVIRYRCSNIGLRHKVWAKEKVIHRQHLEDTGRKIRSLCPSIKVIWGTLRPAWATGRLCLNKIKTKRAKFWWSDYKMCGCQFTTLYCTWSLLGEQMLYSNTTETCRNMHACIHKHIHNANTQNNMY